MLDQGDWYGFKIATARSPRDCPQGCIYMDEVDGFVRIQIVGGKNDGYTVLATEDGYHIPSESGS